MPYGKFRVNQRKRCGALKVLNLCYTTYANGYAWIAKRSHAYTKMYMNKYYAQELIHGDKFVDMQTVRSCLWTVFLLCLQHIVYKMLIYDIYVMDKCILLHSTY